MIRNLTLIIPLLVAQASAESLFVCGPQLWPTGTTSLDDAYAEHSLVFVANVTTVVDAETADIWWSYRLLPPTLKGDIPSEGTLNVDMISCNTPHLALEATVLIFLDYIDEPARADNSVAVVYGGGNVIEKWILEWVAGRLNDR